MSNNTNKLSLISAILLFAFSGTMHLFQPAPFLKIMPSYLPFPAFLVLLSGICEVAGAVGLSLVRTRRAASNGLIALLVAVFPANVAMLQKSAEFPTIPLWVLWLRLPLQILMIYWVYRCGRIDTPLNKNVGSERSSS